MMHEGCIIMTYNVQCVMLCVASMSIYAHHNEPIETRMFNEVFTDLPPCCPESLSRCWDNCTELPLDFECQMNAVNCKETNILASFWYAWITNRLGTGHGTLNILKQYDTPLVYFHRKMFLNFIDGFYMVDQY